jgi:hypothetical protein
MKLGIGFLSKTSEKLQFHENLPFDSRTLLVAIPRWAPHFPYRLTVMVEILQRIDSCDAV